MLFTYTRSIKKGDNAHKILYWFTHKPWVASSLYTRRISTNHKHQIQTKVFFFLKPP